MVGESVVVWGGVVFFVVMSCVMWLYLVQRGVVWYVVVWCGVV